MKGVTEWNAEIGGGGGRSGGNGGRHSRVHLFFNYGFFVLFQGSSFLGSPVLEPDLDLKL